MLLKNNMKYFLLATLIIFLNRTSAQNTPTPLVTEPSSVIIHKDARIDLLVRKQAQINEEWARENRRTMKGYRLMVINTNKRDEAIAAKTKVYTFFPELKSYLLYQSPFFKLKAGNFKTRDEADDYRKRLNAFFPKGVFIISDIIEIKPDKNKETDDI
jgi:hypothetical protein